MLLHHLSRFTLPPCRDNFSLCSRFRSLCGLRGFDKTIILQVVVFLLRIFLDIFHFVVHLVGGRVNSWNMCNLTGNSPRTPLQGQAQGRQRRFS